MFAKVIFRADESISFQRTLARNSDKPRCLHNVCTCVIMYVYEWVCHGRMGPYCTGSAKDPNADGCLQCGEEQQIGTLIMAALGMMGTFGAFFLSLLYLRLSLTSRADNERGWDKYVLCVWWPRHLVCPLENFTLFIFSVLVIGFLHISSLVGFALWFCNVFSTAFAMRGRCFQIPFSKAKSNSMWHAAWLHWSALYLYFRCRAELKKQERSSSEASFIAVTGCSTHIFITCLSAGPEFW